MVLLLKHGLLKIINACHFKQCNFSFPWAFKSIPLKYNYISHGVNGSLSFHMCVILFTSHPRIAVPVWLGGRMCAEL